MVTSIIGESNRLKNEIRRLEEKVQGLDRENRTALERHRQFSSDLKRLNGLEDCNRRMEEDQSAIRSKVQNILENLEKMDFA